MDTVLNFRLRVLLVASLIFSLLTIPTSSASAADTVVSFTVESAESPASDSVSLPFGTEGKLKFLLTTSSATTVTFQSAGVGSISGASADSGFSAATKIDGSAISYPATSLKIVSSSNIENSEQITVTSSEFGTQTVTASYVDPVTTKTTTKTVTIFWTAAPTTGILLSYLVDGVLTPSTIEQVWNQNGQYLYA